jgi:triosephosphate isomerase
MPQSYLIANWKMNVPPEGIAAYVEAVANAVVAGAPPAPEKRPKRPPPQIVVAPPFLYLRDLKRLPLAAQNCADQRSGAFTGEISPQMLAEAGVEFVILGHSERRNIYGENDALIARKLALAIECGLHPILCIGESQEVRESGRTAGFVADQIEAAAGSVSGDVIVAYEPVWAIGTGRNATGAMVAQTVADIRQAIARSWPSRFSDVSVLYGGSVTPDNIDDLSENGKIDGYLVGGASLDSQKFLAIYRGLPAD